MGSTKKYHTINGLVCVAREFGIAQSAKKILIILHGWNQQGGESWAPIAHEISLANKDTLIVVPDMPGFGHSEAPKEVWDITTYSLWCKQLVEWYGIKERYLVGHSFGGAVAAITTPEIGADGLILVAPAIIRKKVKTVRETFLLNVSKQLAFLKVIKPLRWLVHRLAGSSDYYQTHGIMSHILAKVVSQDLQEYLPLIECNTLIIWGEKDTYTPLWQAHIIANGIKWSKLVTLKKINHGVHFHAKDKLIAYINNSI